MIFERAEIRVKAGEEANFVAAVQAAAPLFKRAKGCVSMQLERSVEYPDRYTLVVGWQTVEDHTVDFRNSADFQEWRRLAGPYFAEPPQVQHLDTVLQAF